MAKKGEVRTENTEMDEEKISKFVQTMRKDGKVEYTLLFPIEWGDDEISKLTLKRPKAKHIKHLSDRSDLGAILRIVSKVSGLSQAIIDELDSKDATALADLMGELL